MTNARWLGFLGFLGLSLAAASDLKAPDFKVTVLESASGSNVSIDAPQGYHFNLDAPKALILGKTKIKPTQATEHKMEFTLPKQESGAASLAFVEAYLCDDAKTFCEKHAVTVTTGARVEGRSAENVSEPAASGKMENGFFVNQPDLALATAKKEGKPLMIDFFGIWCPPCNQLDAEVFPSPEFKKVAATFFVKLKLDADAPVSWKLKSKYKIGGYPTVIFASSDGDEIARVVGFRPKAEFVSAVSDAWAKRDHSLEKLRTMAAKGDRDALDRIGMIELERHEYAQAAKDLEGSKAHRDSWFEARIEAEPSDLAKVIQEALTELPKNPASLDWRAKLADLQKSKGDEAARRKTLQDIVTTASEIVADPSGLKGLDDSVMDVLVSSAEAHEALDEKDLAKKDYAKAAAEYAKVTRSLKDRGNALEQAYCLWKSGDTKAADALYAKFEKKYGNEFTYFYAHGHMKDELGDTKEALALYRKAYALSYGDNRLRVTYALAKLEDKSGARESALKHLDEVMGDSKLPEDSEIRTHRYFKKLVELQTELKKPKT